MLERFRREKRLGCTIFLLSLVLRFSRFYSYPVERFPREKEAGFFLLENYTNFVENLPGLFLDADWVP
jgi:hypothetical protein